MPAAPILVNPADAVYGQFFNIDLFQDAGLFAAHFDYFIRCFHFDLLLALLFRTWYDASLYTISTATPMPTYKTTIYPLIAEQDGEESPAAGV